MVLRLNLVWGLYFEIGDGVVIFEVGVSVSFWLDKMN